MKRKTKIRPVNRNIRRLRQRKGLTQQELGERVGEHKSVISHWEAGRYSPTTDKLPVVAAALDVTTDLLLSRSAA